LENPKATKSNRINDITKLLGDIMWKKIKSFMIGAGIMGLIIFFYMTGRSAKLNKLRKLMNKQYNDKLKKLDKKIADTKELGKTKEKKRSEIRKEVKELNAKKKEIKKNVKNLDSNDMANAVDDWFKSRKTS
tara:strand:+ start:6278 stop:6673 length:396 start_codon:yes stop_codon:yes gene_type:complete